MEMRALGPSGLQLSLVGLGCNQFGGRLDYAAAAKVIHRALDLGINHFDSADVYGGGGKSEEIVGKALAGRRDKAVIVTKFGKPMADNPSGHRGSAAYVAAAVERSLKRLATDRIDLLYMHEPDPTTPIEETLQALDRLVKAGKVRHVAASNFSAEQIAAAVAAAKKLGVTGFVASQEEYSLLARGIEAAVLPKLAELGLGLVPFFPIAGGALSGKYRKGQAAIPEGRLNTGSGYSERFLGEARFAKVEALAAFAEARGRGLLELAMSWLAGRPQVASIITGATRPEQLDQNVKAVGWKLSAADLAEIDRITA
jgi:aryl-alcohol dehydrogenase-like predicted oxidoreductase